MDEPAAIARVEALLGEVEALPDPAAREAATALAQALLELHGEGLGRLIGHVSDQAELAAAVTDDPVVANLLLLHGLHPVPLEQRVRGALDEVRPYLETHGGNVELVAVEDGIVHLRLEGSCSGCPSSRVTLEHAIEAAIHEAAPDVEEIRAQDGPAPPGLIQIELACPVPAR